MIFGRSLLFHYYVPSTVGSFFGSFVVGRLQWVSDDVSFQLIAGALYFIEGGRERHGEW